MAIKIPTKLKLVGSVISGGLLPLAFAPFDISFFAFISPILLLVFLSGKTVKKAFLNGWLFGLGLFSVGSSWIFVSIHDHGQTNFFLALLITALFVVILALFLAVMALILNLFTPQENFRRTVLAFPALWVGFEIFRGWFLTGFPWLYLGYSQMKTHLIHYAPISSVFAVSYAVALLAGITYYFLYLLSAQVKNRTQKISLIFLFFIIWIGGYFLSQITWTFPMGRELEVALVQGNVPQFLRWEPQAVNHIIETYENLTLQNLDADIIVWPESAIPLALPYAKNLYQSYGQLATRSQAAIFAGVPEKVEGQEAYYNSLLGIGLAKGIYRKNRLVPFGEYVPLEKYLRGLIGFFDLPMSSFVPSTQQDTISAFGYQFGPAICGEITYPNLVRKISNQSDILITVSNDTWFGHSLGPAQHLQIAQFRALETGRYLIRATNTGITAIINPEGRIIKEAPQFTETVLRGPVFPMQGKTPWMQWGLRPLGILLSILFLLSLIRKPKRKRKKS